MKAETGFSLKDDLFNPDSVGLLAGWVGAAWPDLDTDRFESEVLVKFPELELKARIAHIADVLAKHLPDDFDAAVGIVVASLPPRLDPALTDDDFGNFILAPLSHFVAVHGATEEHLDQSLDALREITMRFSAEFAIRIFINAFPEQTLAFLSKCATDDNYHVRRLASEGTRPTLPWSGKIVTEYTEPLPILDQLYSDPTRFVTRSVANHLNDIAKIDPDLVIATLKRWQKADDQDDKEMAFIIEHASRTLVKQGSEDALKLMGYGEKPSVEISDFATSTPQVVVGTAFEFAFTLTAKKAQKLMIDYVMDFAGSDGKARGRKVFKLKRLDVEPGRTVTVAKKHPMKLMTTRRLYEGEHTITLQVNGKSLDALSFNLSAS